MIYLSLSSSETNKFKRSGRPPAYPKELTSFQIKQEASRIQTLGLSSQAWQVLDWLSVGGVMSTHQLKIKPRTLRKYAQAHLLTRLPFTSTELASEFTQYGLPYEPSETHLYILGPVGLEIATRRHTYPPLTGHLSYPLARTMHDVILNEIVLRLAAFAEKQEWRVTWMGTNTATLFDAEKTRQILEPDVLLIFQKDNQERRFCVEYHNEDKQTRAEKKVHKYQSAYESGTWRQQWETDTFPNVLAVFEKKIVGIGYQSVLKGRKTHVTFCGKLLAGILQDNLAEWAVFATGERLAILN